MIFYLTGHSSLHNRGCEAIIRGTVNLLRQGFKEPRILVPGTDIEMDRAQWPEARDMGVSFVPAYAPDLARYWVHFQRLPFPALKRAGWPFPLPSKLRQDLARSDAVLSVGGDNYSLDYRLPSLLMGMDRAAMDAGVKVVLWGASVGPFEKEPHFVPAISRHLSRMTLIAVREPVTLHYLKGLKLENVFLGADPAFAMPPEDMALDSFWPRCGNQGVLGLNMSPLLEVYRRNDARKEGILDVTENFIKRVIGEYDLSIIFIPHVVPYHGAKKNNDHAFMGALRDRLGDMDGRLTMTPPTLNAAQTKYVISRCRFFIGARTHSTIAALSSHIPTLSIAYSVKAGGINQDIFGHTRYVLDVQKISSSNLMEKFQALLEEEDTILKILPVSVDRIKERARLCVRRLASLLQ